jgi:hypothetical protein
MFGGGVAELRAKRFDRAKSLFERSRELAARFMRCRRRHRAPEKIVIEMPATIVFNGGTNFRGQLVGVTQQLRERELLQLRRSRQCFVELLHVSAVVLVMMNAQSFSVDVRLERVIGVGQVGQVEWICLT